jgi:hypothetical protein
LEITIFALRSFQIVTIELLSNAVSAIDLQNETPSMSGETPCHAPSPKRAAGG